MKQYHSAFYALHSTINSCVAHNFAQRLLPCLLHYFDGSAATAGPAAYVNPITNDGYVCASNYRYVFRFSERPQYRSP